MANRISVPDNTEALHAIGEYVMQYEAMQNAYLTALVKLKIHSLRILL